MRIQTYPGLTLWVAQELRLNIMDKGRHEKARRPDGTWHAPQLEEPGTVENRVGGEGW